MLGEPAMELLAIDEGGVGLVAPTVLLFVSEADAIWALRCGFICWPAPAYKAEDFPNTEVLDVE